MTPWTALLESLHSAWIDELTDRHPEPKPELGMPARAVAWGPPTGGQGGFKVVVCEVTFKAEDGAALASNRGLAFIVADDAFLAASRLAPEPLFNAIFSRAATEFERRGIRPRLSQTSTFAAAVAAWPSLPKGFPEPARLIWMPLKLGEAQGYLGMGVAAG